MSLNKAVTDHHSFAHPIEAEFARILDYYGIEWEYEPRTFPLERNEAGKITLAFTPDFYLPGQDLFVELTTLRPSLIRLKNYKIRRLRELYPDVNIKLLKRSDLHNLMIKFGLDDQASRIAGTEAQDKFK
jgi:hypoxanthine phosphoribosyltransferase